MIALLDTSQDLDQCEVEIGAPVGQLLTPLTRYLLRDSSRPWAIDNGGYSKLNTKGLMSLLERQSAIKDQCKFVAVPDVVASARRTLEIFDVWKDRLTGWPLALVCQDGQEDLPMPWGDIAAVFIGGSTAWKQSAHVEHIIKAAQALDKWVHVGRVNSQDRFTRFEKLGADSCDGTGIARYTHMREDIGNRNKRVDLFHD